MGQAGRAGRGRRGLDTSLAVIDIEAGRFVLQEKLAGLSFDDLQGQTGARLHLTGPVSDLTVPEL